MLGNQENAGDKHGWGQEVRNSGGKTQIRLRGSKINRQNKEVHYPCRVNMLLKSFAVISICGHHFGFSMLTRNFLLQGIFKFGLA